jgi:hypothetical protein
LDNAIANILSCPFLLALLSVARLHAFTSQVRELRFRQDWTEQIRRVFLLWKMEMDPRV